MLADFANALVPHFLHRANLGAHGIIALNVPDFFLVRGVQRGIGTKAANERQQMNTSPMPNKILISFWFDKPKYLAACPSEGEALTQDSNIPGYDSR